MQPTLTWRLGGLSGEGVDAAGDVMARTVARSGFHLYTYREFSTQIRGGYTSYELSMGPRPVMARSDDLDLLVALTRETIERSLADLTRDAVLIHDSSGF